MIKFMISNVSKEDKIDALLYAAQKTVYDRSDLEYISETDLIL